MENVEQLSENVKHCWENVEQLSENEKQLGKCRTVSKSARSRICRRSTARHFSRGCITRELFFAGGTRGGRGPSFTGVWTS